MVVTILCRACDCNVIGIKTLVGDVCEAVVIGHLPLRENTARRYRGSLFMFDSNFKAFVIVAAALVISPEPLWPWSRKWHSSGAASPRC